MGTQRVRSDRSHKNGKRRLKMPSGGRTMRTPSLGECVWTNSTHITRLLAYQLETPLCKATRQYVSVDFNSATHRP